MKAAPAEMLTFPLVSGGGGVTPGRAHHSSGPQRLGPQSQWGFLPAPVETVVPWRWKGNCVRKFYSLALTWRQLEDKKHARDFYQVTVTFLGWEGGRGEG